MDVATLHSRPALPPSIGPLRALGRRLVASALAFVASWGVMASAQVAADVRIQIVEVDPVSPAVLGHWEHLAIRIAYASDRPITMRGEPFNRGAPVPGMDSGSPRYNAGSGEALFWIAYTEPGHVDRIVITAHDEQMRVPLARTEMEVDLAWTGQRSATVRPRPEWETRLQAERDALLRAAAQEYRNRPTPVWQWALSFVMIWSAPGYLVLQALALWRLRGGWRLAAAIPAVPMALVLAYTVVAFRAGSNLSPLVLIFTIPLALLYLLIVLLLRWKRQPAGVSSG
jgi:hypothetical protein